jgi:hypothetical protein
MHFKIHKQNIFSVQPGEAGKKIVANDLNPITETQALSIICSEAMGEVLSLP